MKEWINPIALIKDHFDNLYPGWLIQTEDYANSAGPYKLYVRKDRFSSDVILQQKKTLPDSAKLDLNWVQVDLCWQGKMYSESVDLRHPDSLTRLVRSVLDNSVYVGTINTHLLKRPKLVDEYLEFSRV